jgi:hypothetical protein
MAKEDFVLSTKISTLHSCILFSHDGTFRYMKEAVRVRNIQVHFFRFLVPCIVLQYVWVHPTRCNCITLDFIWRSLHVSGIHRAHHREYSAASAVIHITYERWIVECMVASAFKAVQNGLFWTALTLTLPNLFLNFSTSICKMWIIHEPKNVELWNKRHFEEKRTENVQHV